MCLLNPPVFVISPSGSDIDEKDEFIVEDDFDDGEFDDDENEFDDDDEFVEDDNFDEGEELDECILVENIAGDEIVRHTSGIEGSRSLSAARLTLSLLSSWIDKKTKTKEIT